MPTTHRVLGFGSVTFQIWVLFWSCPNPVKRSILNIGILPLSIGIFKKGILDFVRPRPKTLFGIHDPMRIKFIFQLRVLLIKLKSHKISHNFVETPDDRCDCISEKEDTSFFFVFPICHTLSRTTKHVF